MRERNDSENAFSRLEYRRYVAWSSRIEREAPLILDTVGRTPARRVLDLGCGTGEHSRFLADQGFEVVGVDLSERLLNEAREEGADRIEYLHADLAALPELGLEGFGGAICLGNTLVNLREETALGRFARGLAAALVPGGRLLLQILNYAGLRERNVRHLPLNFLQEDREERVFLRIMQFLPGGIVRFFPTTLRLVEDSETPVEVVHSRSVTLRGWEREELRAVFERNGLRVVQVFGDMVDAPFDETGSDDLVMIAERAE